MSIDPAKMDFTKFAKSVRNTIHSMSKGDSPVHRSSVSGDALWDAYLAAFPPGADPILPGRKFSHHTCSCCRAFIKNAGTMVKIGENGSIKTIWDAPTGDPVYDIVAKALGDLVRSAPIENVFLSSQSHWGVERNFEIKPHLTSPIGWDHFSVVLAPRLVCSASELGTKLGAISTNHAVFLRGLREMKLSNIETVHDLIVENSIYRGAEHRNLVESFISLKKRFDKLTQAAEQVNFAWLNLDKSSSRFRNSVIGSLVLDLDDGVYIDDAVARFESKVAPQNYRRSSAPITQGMVASSLEKLRELGLEPALKRRFAKIDDISVNDVIWASGRVSPLMKDPLRDLLAGQIKPTGKKPTGANEISVDEFFESVVPGASEISLHLERSHLSNLVTLTAPEYPDSKHLFFWENHFSWAYKGGATDSIKEKVKAAGGKVDCKFRVSLSWFNYDDLDIHCNGPMGHIYFGDRKGILDVDMNAGSGQSRSPVENLAFNRMSDGEYVVYVNQYTSRESIDTGFEVEVEHKGDVRLFSYQKPQSFGQNIVVLRFKVVKGEVVDISPDKTVSEMSRSTPAWGLTTGEMIPVDSVMLSPNYWESSTQKRGNKHYIFSLRGALADEPVRGFFNEYLHPELNPHRKVLEVLADKIKCDPTPDQVSGVGFSSTRQDVATFTVKGSDGNKKMYTVKF